MTPINILLYAGVLFGWSTSWLPLSWQLGVVARNIAILEVLDGCAHDGSARPSFGQTLMFNWRVHWRFAALGLCIFQEFCAVLPCGQWRCIRAPGGCVFDRSADECGDGVDNWPEVAASASCIGGSDRYWRCCHANGQN